MIPAFTNELKYIRNVSSTTLELYSWSFKAFDGAMENRASMVARIGELRDKGAKPVTVNTYLRCLNSYFNWLYKEHGRERLKLPKLKEEQTVIASFSPEQVARIVNWKPVKGAETRLHTLTLTALDSGLRINEMLCLRRADVDLDNLLLRVTGKGNKERLVPMSVELRKVLYRYHQAWVRPGVLIRAFNWASVTSFVISRSFARSSESRGYGVLFIVFGIRLRLVI